MRLCHNVKSVISHDVAASDPLSDSHEALAFNQMLLFLRNL